MPTQPYIIDGKRVPSVTTILGKFKDPGALQHWAWSIANDVLMEAVDVIQKGNGAATKFLETRPLERANFRNISKDACTAGTIAHDIVQSWIISHPETRSRFLNSITQKWIIFEYNVFNTVAKAAYTAIQAFRQWVNQNQFQLEQTEVPLLSREYGYGGTLDCLGRILGRELVLFDWKTSSGVYLDYLAQIAAYKQLWDENNEEKIHAAHLIRFDKVTGDFAHYAFSNLDDALRYFLLLREAYSLQHVLQKRLG